MIKKYIPFALSLLLGTLTSGSAFAHEAKKVDNKTTAGCNESHVHNGSRNANNTVKADQGKKSKSNNEGK